MPLLMLIIFAVLIGSRNREIMRWQEQWRGLDKRRQPQADFPAMSAETFTRPAAQVPQVPERRLASDLTYEGPGHAGDGTDPCHDGMTAQPVPIGQAVPTIPGIRLDFTADELVKGVIYAEILARPMARRR